MKPKLKNLKYSFRCMGLLIKRHPIFLLAQIISTICLVFNTLIPINLVSSIVTSYQNRANLVNPFYDILKIILINISIVIVVDLINLIVDFLMYYINAHFTLSFSTTLFKKLSTIDYEFHENASFLDNYTRALDGGAEKIYNVAINQVKAIKTLIQSISVFTIIFNVHYLAVIYSVAVAIIYAFVRRRSSEIQYERNTSNRPIMRKEWYIARTYFVKDSIPDIKTTSINEIMIDKHMELQGENLKVYNKYMKKKTIYDSFGAVLMLTIYPFILAVVSYVTLDIKDLAMLASLTVAATTISNLVNSFTGTLTTIQFEALEAKVSFEVLDMDSKIEGSKGEIIDKFDMLEVDNISFAYQERKVLDSITLKIKKGEKIAIVGSNGAGKTTLVKLLLRLYDVNNGSIMINGTNYINIDTKYLRKKIGAVFQNPEVYSVTIGENVLLKKVETIDEINKVNEALKFADLYDYVMTLPEGINTMVTREFNREGAIFSGGQMQKLAVARGYAQNYEVFLLDEPSSSLDPLAEAKMYENMLKLGKDKTLIFISHRLSATANVDYIYLFENGKILEKGTHQELMKIIDGKYQEMFKSQSEKYLDDNNLGDNHA